MRKGPGCHPEDDSQFGIGSNGAYSLENCVAYYLIFLGTQKIIGVHAVIRFMWKMSFIMFLKDMSISTVELWNLLFKTDCFYQTVCQSSFCDIYLILELNPVFKTVYTIYVATH